MAGPDSMSGYDEELEGERPSKASAKAIPPVIDPEVRLGEYKEIRNAEELGLKPIGQDELENGSIVYVHAQVFEMRFVFADDDQIIHWRYYPCRVVEQEERQMLQTLVPFPNFPPGHGQTYQNAGKLFPPTNKHMYVLAAES